MRPNSSGNPPVSSAGAKEEKGRSVFLWIHSLLPYGLAGLVVWNRDALLNEGWAIASGGFAFSSLMCRKWSERELKEMATEANKILKKKKPTQGSLTEED